MASVATRTFEPLYYADDLRLVNPHGDVGLAAMWTPLDTVEAKLRAVAPQLLDPATSRIAALGNLRGEGLYAMLCNLLHNPQVRHVVALGADLADTTAELEAFLRAGVEDAELLGVPRLRVVGTDQILPPDERFDADALRARLTFTNLAGRMRDIGADLGAVVDALPRHPDDPSVERVVVPLDPPPDARQHGPSDVLAHQIVRRGPLDCWEELVVRTMRFGHRVQLAKGERLELLNARAVIREPEPDDPAALRRYGFEPAKLEAYARRMLDPELPADDGISYTYGNRLRGYFAQRTSAADTLQTAIELLRADPETRHAYVSLWDSASDLPDGVSPPCLTTIFFRLSEGRLTITATYRSHNLLDAWLKNVYGLMAIQRHVAAGAGLPAGPVTVVSHSLGIDPRASRYVVADGVEREWETDDDRDRPADKRLLREDPAGHFVVSLDRQRGCIIAEHRYRGVLVKRYEADRAVTIEQQVAADMAVTLVSHALWLGRELTRHEQMLRAGT